MMHQALHIPHFANEIQSGQDYLFYIKDKREEGNNQNIYKLPDLTNLKNVVRTKKLQEDQKYEVKQVIKE